MSNALEISKKTVDNNRNLLGSVQSGYNTDLSEITSIKENRP